MLILSHLPLGIGHILTPKRAVTQKAQLQRSHLAGPSMVESKEIGQCQVPKLLPAVAGEDTKVGVTVE